MTLTLLHTRGVTIPAGTPIATPHEGGVNVPPGIVEAIRWRFPGGCNGQVGIKLASSHVPIYPGTQTEWIVHSGSITGDSVEGFPDSGDFSLLGYNLGSFDHTIQIELRMHRMQPPEPLPGYLVVDAVASLRGGY